MMTKREELHADLSYVRGAVEKSEGSPSVRGIYLLWGLAILIGFPLADFAPGAVPLYWTIVGPVGFLASGFLGYRAGVKRGQHERSLGLRHALHWGGMMICIGLIIPLAATGVLDWTGLTRVILLVLALSYFLAGVHLDRPLMWAGLIMLGGYVLLFFVEVYAWTIIGVVLAAGLFLSAALAGRESSSD